jgi:O-acetyl-ADP-ribose deacetylase (regulator of RNase III)
MREKIEVIEGDITQLAVEAMAQLATPPLDNGGLIRRRKRC